MGSPALPLLPYAARSQAAGLASPGGPGLSRPPCHTPLEAEGYMERRQAHEMKQDTGRVGLAS